MANPKTKSKKISNLLKLVSIYMDDKMFYDAVQLIKSVFPKSESQKQRYLKSLKITTNNLLKEKEYSLVVEITSHFLSLLEKETLEINEFYEHFDEVINSFPIRELVKKVQLLEAYHSLLSHHNCISKQTKTALTLAQCYTKLNDFNKANTFFLRSNSPAHHAKMASKWGNHYFRGEEEVLIFRIVIDYAKSSQLPGAISFLLHSFSRSFTESPLMNALYLMLHALLNKARRQFRKAVLLFKPEIEKVNGLMREVFQIAAKHFDADMFEG